MIYLLNLSESQNTKIQMKITENENFNSNILIEAKFLEQEHRPTHLILNYLNRKKKYPNEDDPRRKAVQKAIIWRLFFSPTFIAVFGITILGVIAAIILIKQTNIIDDQAVIFKKQINIVNDQKLLLEDQNKKIEAKLEVFNRRNNLTLLMNNVLDRVEDELKQKDSSLSKPLIARIQALGQGFEPYEFIDYTLKNSLDKDRSRLTKLISPQRGQLLLSLANSGLGRETMLLICKKTPFDRASLKSAHLSKTYLRRVHLLGADLTGADLSGADLNGADLFTANLTGATLTGATLRRANLTGAILLGATLREADLTGADFTGINLKDADLTNANLLGVNLRETNLKEADFTGANLRKTNLLEADLTGANLLGADLTESDLTEANLTEVNLRGVDLRRTTLTGADFTGADLTIANLTFVNLENIKSIDSCIVDRKDWLIYIRDSLRVNGADILVKEYKVVKDGAYNYRLVKK